MFRIIKLLVSLCSLVGFVWFGMTVDLGERTLFQHVRAIAQSKESGDLVEGTKTTVTGLFGDDDAAPNATTAKAKPPVVIKERPAEASGAKLAARVEPQDGMTAADRQGMRKLIGSRRPTAGPEAHREDRAAGKATK